jgi:hypothetical protein
MPNFFADNDDIRFLFDHFDLAKLARVRERRFPNAMSPQRGRGKICARVHPR